jgi:formiminotetrahydrofolate cyclodeaminase
MSDQASAEPSVADGRLADQRLTDVLDAFAAHSPAPGGGAAVALTAALAAGLVAMAAAYADSPPEGLPERAHHLRARALQLADDDASAYGAVLAARSSGDRETLGDAWRQAMAVPLEVARCAAEAARDAAALVESGWPSLRGDASAGAWLAEAAARSAARLVAINAAESGLGDDLAEQAASLADDAAVSARRTAEA